MADVAKLREQLAKTKKKIDILEARIHLATVVGTPKRESIGGARRPTKARKAAKKATKRAR